ncbi:hypothetical protein ACFVVU_05435 [Kitasatospora sp. NPDC057965]|uniref:hypothetical protein n=1 Tax=Kitasatospora sp. NPDC057965 TaxID=3346291 RepID=UPI0036DA2560
MLRRLRTAAVVLLAVLLLPGDSSTAPADVLVPAGRALEMARQVAEAWPGSETERIWRTGYYPSLEAEYWLPRDFSDDGAFAAFLGDRIDLAAGFPPSRGTGTVSFPDGTSTALPLTDPRAAYENLVRYRDDPCTREPCNTVLTVTEVRPATRPQRTSRGTATVPVWEFRFAGLDEPYAVVAVESQAPPGPHTREDDTLPAWVTDTDYAHREGERRLEASVHLRRCARLLPGEVYETADVLVLVGRVDRPADCEPPGFLEDVRFRSARPVGDRVVLNLAGRPILFPED